MEIVAVIIMVLVGFSLVLKLTRLPQWGQALICLACGLSVGLSWERAAGESKTAIADLLQDPTLMLDVAVVLTVDVVLQVAFCIIDARLLAGEALSKSARILRGVTLWVPGLLIVPVLYALLVEVIFSLPGADFQVLAWEVAAGVVAVGLGLPWLIKRAVPEPDLRLELLFMVNVLVAMLGVVATVNGRTAVAGTNDVDWTALGGVVVLLLGCSGVGYLIFRHRKQKNNLR